MNSGGQEARSRNLGIKFISQPGMYMYIENTKYVFTAPFLVLKVKYERYIKRSKTSSFRGRRKQCFLSTLSGSLSNRAALSRTLHLAVARRTPLPQNVKRVENFRARHNQSTVNHNKVSFCEIRLKSRSTRHGTCATATPHVSSLSFLREKGAACASSLLRLHKS